MRKDIEDLIKSLKLPKFGFKGEYKCAEEYLSGDEEVLFIYPGNASISATKQNEDLISNQIDLKNKKAGIFVITTKRLFHANKLFGHSFEQISAEEIISYRISKIPLMGGTMQIFSNHRTFEVDLSYKKEIIEVAKKAIMQLIESKNSNKKINNVGISLDITEQIKKLSDLKDSGILSDEEFSKKKKELLERI